MRASRFVTLLLCSLAIACGDGPTGETGPNPAPSLNDLDPGTVALGVAPVVTVRGTGYVRSSRVYVESAERPTQFVSDTELRVTLTPGDVAVEGFLRLRVFTPGPGGGTSPERLLSVLRPFDAPPTVATLSPGTLDTGAGATTFTVTGTGFTPGSVVTLDDRVATPTTVLSTTRLQFTMTAEQLDSSGTYAVRVAGGTTGLSNAAVLTVRAPAPTLAAIAPTSASGARPSFEVLLQGTGFVRNSVARVNQVPRHTTYVSATTLRMVLSEVDLAAVRTLPITVHNPGPGGGTTSSRLFQVTTAVPAITLLPSRGAHAGTAGYSLLVHGYGFVPGSVVRVNGAPRPTQLLSTSRLQAELLTSDLAMPGVLELTVANPAPNAVVSSPATVTVRAAGAAVLTSTRTVPLVARDFAVDDLRNRLYVSVGGSAPVDANSIVAVDPFTAGITARVFVGSDPGRVARSDEGSYLYVGLDGLNSMRRVDLATFVPGLQWRLVNPADIAGEIEVLPGQPRSVAVARHTPLESPGFKGVTIYDDATPRPLSSPEHSGASRIAFADTRDTLYGFNNQSTGFEFFTIALDASGARHAFTTGGLFTGFATRIVGAAGRVYGTDGAVVDPVRRQKVGTFVFPRPLSEPSIAVDPELGRAFLLMDGVIAVYDLNTFQRLGTVRMDGYFGEPVRGHRHLQRWGPDGLAFLDADELYIVRSPLFGR